MKLLLDIKNEKAAFVMELLKSLSFVKAKPLSDADAEILEGLKEAVAQVKSAKEEKTELKSARELLNEI